MEKARELRRVKREQTGDTAEAKAERRKQTSEYDAEQTKQRVGKSRRCIFELGSDGGRRQDLHRITAEIVTADR